MSDGLPVPVLMYHDIADDPDVVPAGHRPYVVSSDAFRAHLRLLAILGMGGARLDALLDPGEVTAGGRRSCVLTFDDGHESNFTRALPALLEAGCKATFFVTVGWIGQAPYMSWDQIKSLVAAGMEVGSHSMTHRPPSTLTRTELRAEMADSRKSLEDRIGLPVVTASSPTGFFNPEMIPVAREAGYRALCYGRIGIWKHQRDSFRIPRLPVKHRTTSLDLRALALGNRFVLARLRAQQLARNSLKATLGVDGYLRLRRRLLR